MTSPAPRPSILEIEAYVPGESRLPAGLKPIKLSSNETPLGPSPKAVAAFKETAGELERYPDGAATRLRTAIGGRYGLKRARPAREAPRARAARARRGVCRVRAPQRLRGRHRAGGDDPQYGDDAHIL